ncbi:exopolysaccharide biosynthesis protein [Roseibium sediminicola]|uniref:Exopolysaccharide biosynthesis protein n=1 Tax=Roseibium sediminicola TaxID=2933272 RepID=A0ABT0H083_9HYPH|nr:exopolysaccharide biosynthesis protein [Roseibium sp. CAU 1639]MCK7615094.1 exopolysaccharide biosynthesis protein [Roseibium sp. CAU 1639]
MPETHSPTIEDVLTAWGEEVQEGPSNVGSLMRAAGSRAAGPMLFLPALVMVSPIGAIPGVPIVLTTVIVLVSVQVLAGASSLWLPDVLVRRGIPEDKVQKIIDWLRPKAAWADRYLGRRLAFLAGGAMARAIAGLCMVLAVLVYPLTLFPFAVALPGGAIMLLSLGLLTRDGVVTLLGLSLAGGAIWAGLTVPL